jgi:hypothetical protein
MRNVTCGGYFRTAEVLNLYVSQFARNDSKQVTILGLVGCPHKTCWVETETGVRNALNETMLKVTKTLIVSL